MNIQTLKEEWKELEPETEEHLMTVLDVFAHASKEGNMTPESLIKAVTYIKSWVKYRSQFVRDLIVDKTDI